MTKEFERAIRSSWCKETSADPEFWTPENPAWGQCAVTALVVQDALGGGLWRAVCNGNSHYWNVLPNGTEVDLTIEQFGGVVEKGNTTPRTREYVLSYEATRKRYDLLRWRVGVRMS